LGLVASKLGDGAAWGVTGGKTGGVIISCGVEVTVVVIIELLTAVVL
jgi:hypothetical protein